MLIDGAASDAAWIRERAFQYGDGLFETVAIIAAGIFVGGAFLIFLLLSSDKTARRLGHAAGTASRRVAGWFRIKTPETLAADLADSTVQLDTTRRFTAARARNEGLERLAPSLGTADLDATLARYVNELGYAVDEVFPADAPRLVIVSRGDDRIRLESERAPPETFDLVHQALGCVERLLSDEREDDEREAPAAGLAGAHRSPPLNGV
mgnify:CR=1 FL=1